MAQTEDGHTSARELAETIKNTGAGYEQRCRLGRRLLANPERATIVRLCAGEFMCVAIDGAREYERQFGTAGASCFTVQALFECASELAEYYLQHARETAALEAHEAAGR